MVINVFHLNGAPAIPFNTKSTLKQSINNKSQEPVKSFPMPSHCPVLLPWLMKAPWVMHFISWSVSAFQTCLTGLLTPRSQRLTHVPCRLTREDGLSARWRVGRNYCDEGWNPIMYDWLCRVRMSYFSFALFMSVNTWLDCVCLSIWKWCH